MAFCAKCGIQVDETQNFCPACGAPIGAPAEAPAEAPAAAPAEAPAEAPTEQPAAAPADFASTVQNLNNTPDTTAAYDPADIEKNKVLALLAYIGILWLVPMLAAKDSAYAKFHTNQGLVLWLAGLIGGVAGSILGFIPVLGALISLAISIFFLVLAILGIVNAVQGRAKELPILGKFRILK